jgi:hypothetical protein
MILHSLLIGYSEILTISIILICIFFYRRLNQKKVAKNEHSTDAKGTVSQQNTIPDKCPHCMNPNTKGIRICEWCGSQMV